MSTFNSIKLKDGSIITKKLVNFDVLVGIFNSKQFYNDYKSAVLQSPKLSKSLRDRLDNMETFTLHFLYTCLLININRINTTLAFYWEIKSNLRVYHPIPSLRSSQHLLGDSPRIKNILNSTVDNDCSSLLDVQLRLINGMHPPTSLTNFIFILFNSAQIINRDNMHSGFSLHHLLWPSNIPSNLSSNAFLWLVYHYFHKKSDDISHINPFDDDYSRANPGKCPQLARLNDDQLAHENLDNADDLEWATHMQQQRMKFLSEFNSSPNQPKKRFIKRKHSSDDDLDDFHQDDDTINNPSTLLCIATKDALSKPLDNYSNSTLQEPTHAIARKLDVISWIGGP